MGQGSALGDSGPLKRRSFIGQDSALEDSGPLKRRSFIGQDSALEDSGPLPLYFHYNFHPAEFQQLNLLVSTLTLYFILSPRHTHVVSTNINNLEEIIIYHSVTSI